MPLVLRTYSILNVFEKLSVTGETASDIEVRFNIELENVHDWLTANKLTLNIEKTGYMIIGSYMTRYQ